VAAVPRATTSTRAPKDRAQINCSGRTYHAEPCTGGCNIRFHLQWRERILDRFRTCFGDHRPAIRESRRLRHRRSQFSNTHLNSISVYFSGWEYTHALAGPDCELVHRRGGVITGDQFFALTGCNLDTTSLLCMNNTSATIGILGPFTCPGYHVHSRRRDGPYT
jgi:hypothetical protein